ncbi:MAG: RNA polymerase-binding protein RbpA [Propioniciclava sp.]
MPDKSLKGQGLGSRSLADGEGVELAARRTIAFVCPQDHEFSLTFAAEAELPTLWECPKCGSEARRADGVEPEVKETKPVRTHWDMLRERRSIEELEDILAERLEQIRADD